MKTRFILISQWNMGIHYGAQFGNNAHEQQVHCNNVQPRLIHAIFAASAVPAKFTFFL
jgi:hypothetical protein